MKKRWLWLLLTLGFLNGWVWGQNATVTGTITDSQGTPWAGASVTASFAPTPNFSGNYTWNGQQMRTFPPITVVADGAGNFSLVVPDSTQISPANSGRTFTFCPLASVVCDTSVKTSTPGPTLNITTLVENTVTAPQLNPTGMQYAYNDGEVLPMPGQGQIYYRTSDNTTRQWNGSAWVAFGGGGGGALFPSTSKVVVNTSTTASRNAVLSDITTFWTTGGTGCSTGTNVLQVNGNCTTSSGAPGGANQDIQLNTSGSFGADTGKFTYNSSTHTSTTQNIVATSSINMFTQNVGSAEFIGINSTSNPIYNITNTSAASGLATFTWNVAPGGDNLAPLIGDSVAVTGTTNGGGAFNGTWTVTAVTGSSSGTFQASIGSGTFGSASDTGIAQDTSQGGLTVNGTPPIVAYPQMFGYGGDRGNISGVPGNQQGWRSIAGIVVNGIKWTSGIGQGIFIGFQSRGLGDNAVIYAGNGLGHTPGGCIAASDECVVGVNMNGTQYGGYCAGFVTSTIGLGDMAPVVNCSVGAQPSLYQGGYMINISHTIASGNLVGSQSSVWETSPLGYGSLAVSGTVTPSVGICVLTSNLNGNLMSVLGPPVTQRTFTCTVHDSKPIPTTGFPFPMWILSNYSPEQVKVVGATAPSGGVQTITVFNAEPHVIGDYGFVGGTQGLLQWDAENISALGFYRTDYIVAGADVAGGSSSCTDKTHNCLIIGFRQVIGIRGNGLPIPGVEAQTLTSGYHVFPGAVITSLSFDGVTNTVEYSGTPWTVGDEIVSPPSVAYAEELYAGESSQYSPDNPSYRSFGMRITYTGTGGASYSHPVYAFRNAHANGEYIQNGGYLAFPAFADTEGPLGSFAQIGQMADLDTLTPYVPCGGSYIICFENFGPHTTQISGIFNDSQFTGGTIVEDRNLAQFKFGLSIIAPAFSGNYFLPVAGGATDLVNLSSGGNQLQDSGIALNAIAILASTQEFTGTNTFDNTLKSKSTATNSFAAINYYNSTNTQSGSIGFGDSATSGVFTNTDFWYSVGNNFCITTNATACVIKIIGSTGSIQFPGITDGCLAVVSGVLGSSGSPCGSGGGSGFPITIGSTSISGSSTTTAIAGLSVNGVTLNSTGSSTLFLNQAGAYVSVGGGSGTIVASPQFQIPYYSASGTATTLTGDTGCSTDGAGNMTCSSFTTNGPDNGFIRLIATGTSPGAAPSNTIQIEAPSSVTAYRLIWPGTVSTTGNTILSCTAASPSVCSWVAGGSGGGDTITSPNGTLTVGGTSSATTLDINLATANAWTGAQSITQNSSTAPLTLTQNGSGNTLNMIGSASSGTQFTFQTPGFDLFSIFAANGFAPNTIAFYDTTQTSPNIIMGLASQGSGAGYIVGPALGRIGFIASGDASIAPDTAFSRVSAGVMALGTGAQGSTAGQLNLAATNSTVYTGTGTATIAPGASGQVGTGATAVCTTSYVCDSYSGTITLTTGTGVLTAGTIATVTFPNTRTNKPSCAVDIEGGSTFLAGSHSATTSVLTYTDGVAVTVSTVYTLTYVCGGI